MGKGSLGAAAQTLSFVQLEARLTLSAEVPAEAMLTVRRAAFWEERDHQTSITNNAGHRFSFFNVTVLVSLAGSHSFCFTLIFIVVAKVNECKRYGRTDRTELFA